MKIKMCRRTIDECENEKYKGRKHRNWLTVVKIVILFNYCYFVYKKDLMCLKTI